MNGFVFYGVMIFVAIGVLFWKAIQQVLLFRKDRKWTGKFVMSATWIFLVAVNIVLQLKNLFL